MPKPHEHARNLIETEATKQVPSRSFYECTTFDKGQHYDGIVAFSQTDFTEDLKKITVPVLVMHSEDDQIVPYVAAGPLSAKLLRNGTMKTYKGFPHGMPTTEAETINADLLTFLKKSKQVAA
ncbi:MAG TPA: alpha/beta hydrolase [Terriglobales bacterium]|nr:alpha/beta hydrolase [Terriglobales bacterium]